jgi:predicted nucleic acid-binding Zn ribbon protein
MEPLHQTIPDAVARLVRNAPLSAEKVTFAWRASVGSAMARASAVRLSSDGVVEVMCDDDHWRREIRRSLPLIKERLLALLGAEVVKQLKLPAATRPTRRR